MINVIIALRVKYFTGRENGSLNARSHDNLPKPFHKPNIFGYNEQDLGVRYFGLKLLSASLARQAARNF